MAVKMLAIQCLCIYTVSLISKDFKVSEITAVIRGITQLRRDARVFGSL
jgi:hypothetical protein